MPHIPWWKLQHMSPLYPWFGLLYTPLYTCILELAVQSLDIGMMTCSYTRTDITTSI
ncbi:hypothetical protein BJX68DRAFT_237786 [Aspergillus pseudodeflectus]|uniref:Uncharacterized protein n=1 Tax=Aspergillus pseudodeflectus TaxID=176178 RepID=A0ABR4KBY7_9EURO